MDKTEVSKAADHVTLLIDKRPNAVEVWASLTKMLDGIMHNAQETLRLWEAKRPVMLPRLKAAMVINEVLSEANHREVAAHMVAVGYISETNHGRFIDDSAYHFTFVRRFQSLGRSSFAGTIGKDGVRRQALKDIRSTASRHLGALLAAAFGPVGATLREQEMRAAEQAKSRSSAPLQALAQWTAL